MDWAYIAGFFDGEGHAGISMGAKSSVKVELSFAQSGSLAQVLFDEMKIFFRNEGVRSSFYPVKLSGRERKPKFRLYIQERQSACSAIRAMMPWLRIKRLICQDILRFLTLYTSLKPFALDNAHAATRGKSWGSHTDQAKRRISEARKLYWKKKKEVA